MKTWYVCTVRYQKEDDHGRIKNVTEKYLVDALSFTEAEAMIYEEMGQRVMGEFHVKDISRTSIVDVFEFAGSDQFYQAKVSYMITDSDSGKEKKVNNLMLVTAHSVDEAHNRLKESLNNMLVTFTVPEIKESPVLEVFHHYKKESQQ